MKIAEEPQLHPTDPKSDLSRRTAIICAAFAIASDAAAYIPLLFLSLLVVTVPVVTRRLKYIRPALRGGHGKISALRMRHPSRKPAPADVTPARFYVIADALRDLEVETIFLFPWASCFATVVGSTILLPSRCSPCLFSRILLDRDIGAALTRRRRRLIQWSNAEKNKHGEQREGNKM